VTLRFTQPGIGRKLWLENWQIRRALRRWGADVLFSTSDTSIVGCRVPHLLLVHQSNLAHSPAERHGPMPVTARLRWRLMDVYLTLGLRTVTTLTVQTHDMAARMSDRFGFPRERIAVIPSAVERKEHATLETDALENAPPFVTYVSSASPHKNFAVLAPMMAHLRDRCPDLQCRVTVTPEQVPDLVREAERLQVAESFVFLGRVSQAEAARLLRRAKALVMPSKLESFGLPYYEAMAEGTPVVAADRAFAHEACGDAGAYADADSGEAFADAVAELIDDEALYKARSEAALARFEAVGRSWDAITAEYLQILQSLHANAPQTR
jgi:glycosyltransferase involved in cell wall biosynthesis